MAENGAKLSAVKRDPDSSAASRGERLRARAAMALRAAANALLAALRFCLWPRRPDNIRRIGVYRIGNIGDIVCALPALHAIRHAYPKAHLTLVTSPGKPSAPGARELLEGADWLDELIVYYRDGGRGWLDLIRQLRARRFDLWIALPPAPARMRRLVRDMLVARLARVRWGRGWQLDAIRVWRAAQSHVFTFPQEAERLMSIVKRAGMNATEYIFPLPLAGAVATVDTLLRDGRAIAHRPLVAIAPGAKRPTNRWPVERFKKVATALSADGFSVVVLGSAAETGICTEVAAVARMAGLNLAGRTSLLETCELLRRCCLLICNDSGVQHLAAAVGTPCLSIFSFRDFRGRWHPYGEHNIVLQKWVPCATCMLESCPYDNLCVKLIESDEVLEHALRMLNVGPNETRSTLVATKD